MAVGTTGNSKIDNLLLGFSWTGNSGQAVTVTYNPNLSNWSKSSLDGVITKGVNPAPFTNITLLKDGLSAWSNVANITFQSTTSITPDFAVRLADSLQAKNGNIWEAKNAFVATFNQNSLLDSADMLVDKDILTNTAKGTYGYYTIVHEIGHILGLRDVFDNQYSKDTSILSYAFSVENPHTPMMYDIAAAQYLYGVNTSYNSGNTNYGNTYITGEKRLWTIWDAGGVDTIDVSQLALSKGVKIDLRGGVDKNGKARLSEIGDERIAIALDPNTGWKEAIDIEKAVGTRHKDILIGGNGKHQLMGSGDTDLLVAGGDESRLYGGRDADIFEVANGAFIEDGEGKDYTTWGGIRLTGGVKSSWSESPYVYYGGFGAVVANAPGPTANLLSALSTIIELPMATTARYARTESGQLLIDFGLGRAGQAVVQDYDYLEGTAGITVFQGVLGQFSKEKYSQYVKLALKAAGLEFAGTDPLVIDMDKDGMELSRVGAHNSVYFDQDGNGFAENMGWVKPDDALLVRDMNNNGKVDGWGELFGTATQSGFVQLKGFDSNNDNRITSADSNWSKLRVWQDANNNGVSEVTELKTLAQAGITQFSLTTRTPQVGQVRGNDVMAIGDVTFADGGVTTMGDVVLERSVVDTRWTGAGSISAAAAALPALRGYGAVKDLRVAMSENAPLLGLVNELANFTPTTPWATIGAKTQAVLFNWAGVQGVVPTIVAGTNNKLDLQKLAFLEKYFGTQLTTRNVQGQIVVNNANELLKSWENVLADSTMKLAAQGVYDAVLGTDVRYDVAEDTLQLQDANSLADIYKAIFTQLPAASTAAQQAWNTVWSPFLVELQDEMIRPDGVEVRADYVAQALLQAKESATTSLTIAQLAAGVGIAGVQVAGSATANLQHTGTGMNVFIVPNATGGTFTGGVGQDIYLFSGGFKSSTITDTDVGETGDRLRFAAHRPSDMTIARSGDDLLITDTVRAQTVRIVGHFKAPIVDLNGNQISPNTRIEEIQFADGQIMEAADIAVAIGKGTAGNDTITGTAYSDELDGGLGNDILRGGDAADNYYYVKGGGQDRIEEQMSNPLTKGADALFLLGGITAESLQLSRNGASNDLVISFNDTAGSLTIKDQFAYNALGFQTRYALDSRIEAIFFEKGQGLNWLDIQEQLIQQSTTSGNDTIYGYGVGDVFEASAGNDLMIGYDGGDVYHIASGMGQDTVHDQSRYPHTFVDGLIGYSWNDNDVVQFAEGITPADVTFARLGAAPDLQISIAGMTDTLTITKQFEGTKLDLFNLLGVAWFNRVEEFRFADGTVIGWQEVLQRVTTGTSGNDSLYGAMYPDTVIGGTGNDFLAGGDDGDRYIFKSGDGNDTIADGKSNILLSADDTLAFGAGITPQNTVFSRVGTSQDMMVRFTSNATDSILIQKQYDITETGPFGTQEFNRIERFTWQDGTVKTWDAIARDAIAASSTLGNDTIVGTHFNDTLAGGKGNDYMTGGNGADTYVFNRGDGVDTVEDKYNNVLAEDGDKITFGTTILPSDIVITRTGATFAPLHGKEDMTLTLRNTTDSVTVKKQFAYPAIGVAYDEVETIAFSNGTSWNALDVQRLYLQQQSTSGNDLIEGFEFDDSITGGAGNDTLRGGDGNDNYIFASGFGQDTIEESVNLANHPDNDNITFNATINKNNITFTRASDDLIIGLSNATDKITIKDQFKNFAYFGGMRDIEAVTFADGTVWTDSTIRSVIVNNAATTGNDNITGFWSSDSINGKAGSDTLQGLGGGDTYVFEANFGQDTVQESAQTVYEDYPDMLHFTSYNRTNLSFVKQVNDLLITVNGTSHSVRVVNHFGSPYARVEFIKFADGSIVDASTVTQGAIAAQATSGNDVITGTNGNDTLTGGLGNDTFNGGDGSDIYVFDEGFGQSIINEQKLAFGVADEDSIIFRGALTSNRALFSRSGEDLIIQFQGSTSKLTVTKQFESLRFKDVETFTFADGRTITEQEVRQQLIEASNTAGNDTRLGFWSDDIFYTSLGNDTMQGAQGNDTYHFGVGSGKDLVRDLSTTGGDSLQDRIIFGEGIAADTLLLNVALRNSSNMDMVIGLANSTDELRIESQFINNDTSNSYRIEFFEFANGDVLTSAQMRDLYFQQKATGGNDTISGTHESEMIFGGAGNDVITGENGNDTFIGGLGNDTLLGKYGNNTFQYGYGEGSDAIIDNPLSGAVATNTLYFTGEITLDDLRFSRPTTGIAEANSKGLIVTFANDAGSVTMGNQFSASGTTPQYAVHQIQFESGGIITAEDMKTRYLEQQKTDGNDVILGFYNQGATLEGGAGNDSITGSNRNDTLMGGEGKDSLTGGLGNDNFVFTTIVDNQAINADSIADFVRGADKIDVRGLGFTSFDTDGGTTEAGELRYSKSGSITTVLSDQTGFNFQMNLNDLNNADFMWT
jgi:Ca2+-binding RTX toxin-like protein